MKKPSKKSPVEKKTSKGIRRSRPAPLALEQRFMFDGAAVADVVAAAVLTGADSSAATSAAPADQAAPAAQALPEATPATQPAPAVSAPVDADRGVVDQAVNANTSRELVIIDPSVADADKFAAARPDAEVITLGAGDPWQQITAALASHPGTTAVHLVTHAGHPRQYTSRADQLRPGRCGGPT